MLCPDQQQHPCRAVAAKIQRQPRAEIIGDRRIDDHNIIAVFEQHAARRSHIRRHGYRVIAILRKKPYERLIEFFRRGNQQHAVALCLQIHECFLLFC